MRPIRRSVPVTLALLLGFAGSALAQGFWTPPVLIPEVSSTSSDYYPFISGDLQSIRVASSRQDLPAPPSPAGGWHIWQAQRSTRYGAFGPMVAEPGAVQTAQNDLAPWVMPDELTMYSATSTPLPGQVAGFDIYEWTRPNNTAPWTLAGNVAGVNTTGTDYMPSVTADGLEMYVTASNRVVQSTRLSTTAPWGPSTVVAGFTSHGHSGISMNGLELFTATGGNLHYATRRSRQDAWTVPQPLSALNNQTSGTNNRPSLSIDGRELFFSSSRPANTPGVSSVSVWTSRWVGLSLEGLPTIGQALKIHITNPVRAGAPYQVGMSFTNLGGIPIPGVGRIPLDPDDLLVLSTSGRAPAIFSNFGGVLDIQGEGTAQLNIPGNAALKGVPFEVAAVTLGQSGIDYITNGISTRID